MMTRGASVQEMIPQSIAVMTKPSVATFEQYERRGGQREALTYVGAAAAIAAVAALIGGLISLAFGGSIITAIVGAIFAAIATVVSFFVYAWLVFTVGKAQGGTGTQDEVFYSLSLFQAPIQAINGAVGAIPILGCLAVPLTFALGIYGIFLGYLAVRSSMNLDQNKAIITMVVAFLGTLVISAIFGAIMLFILTALGVSTMPADMSIPTS